MSLADDDEIHDSREENGEGANGSQVQNGEVDNAENESDLEKKAEAHDTGVKEDKTKTEEEQMETTTETGAEVNTGNLMKLVIKLCFLCFKCQVKQIV